jgi:hypothetical protein
LHAEVDDTARKVHIEVCTVPVYIHTYVVIRYVGIYSFRVTVLIAIQLPPAATLSVSWA